MELSHGACCGCRKYYTQLVLVCQGIVEENYVSVVEKQPNVCMRMKKHP